MSDIKEPPHQAAPRPPPPEPRSPPSAASPVAQGQHAGLDKDERDAKSCKVKGKMDPVRP